jgi:hypothetical protein
LRGWQVHLRLDFRRPAVAPHVVDYADDGDGGRVGAAPDLVIDRASSRQEALFE